MLLTEWVRCRKFEYLRNNRGVGDARVCNEQGFELGRRNLEPFVLDYLLKPVDDEDLIVVVDETDVSSVEPSFLVYGVLCGLRVVEIA